MNILVLILGAKMGGAIRHLTNFLPIISRNDDKNIYTFYVNKDFDIDFIQGKKLTFKKKNSVITNFPVVTFLYYLFFLPIALYFSKYDIIISLLNYGPAFSSLPHITFQRNSLFFCDYYINNIPANKKKEFFIRKWLLTKIMRNCSLVVTPTDSMRESIFHHLSGLKKEKFITLYHGFEKSSYETIFIDKQLAAKYSNKLKIFFPSHSAIHKGVDLLLEMVGCFAKLYDNFVLILPFDERDSKEEIANLKKLSSKFNVQDKVDFIGRIEQNRIKYYYDMSDIIIFSSMCESFGFPLLESLAFAKPIVSVDTELSREICGDAALYYEPFKPEEAAKVLNKMTDINLRNEYSGRAVFRFNAKDWSWKRYTNEFLDIVNRFRNA